MNCKVYTDKETFEFDNLEEANKIFKQAKNAIFTANGFVLKNSKSSKSINKSRFNEFKTKMLIQKLYGPVSQLAEEQVLKT